MFLLFRLYGILYDRLKNARALESPSMRQVLPFAFACRHSPANAFSLCSALISSVMRKPRPYPTAVRGKALILGCSVL